MHAMTGLFSMDPAHKTQLIEGLPSLINMIREMPGYVVGFWTWDHATNVSSVLVVFEREEQARGLEAVVKSNDEKKAFPGTRLERASTSEIVGAASGNAARKTDGANLWARLGSSGH
jgi:hypothetical protein